MAAITFTDAIGTATLRPRVATGRFGNWAPMTRSVGDSATALGTGALHLFRFRIDYGATFSLGGISAHKDVATGLFMHEVADRLIKHLLEGGTCTVLTEDNSGNTYTPCGLLPGASPSLELSDARLLEYTLTLGLVHLAAVPSRMTCRYGSV